MHDLDEVAGNTADNVIDDAVELSIHDTIEAYLGKNPENVYLRSLIMEKLNQDGTNKGWSPNSPLRVFRRAVYDAAWHAFRRQPECGVEFSEFAIEEILAVYNRLTDNQEAKSYIVGFLYNPKVQESLAKYYQIHLPVYTNSAPYFDIVISARGDIKGVETSKAEKDLYSSHFPLGTGQKVKGVDDE